MSTDIILYVCTGACMYVCIRVCLYWMYALMNVCGYMCGYTYKCITTCMYVSEYIIVLYSISSSPSIFFNSHRVFLTDLGKTDVKKVHESSSFLTHER